MLRDSAERFAKEILAPHVQAGRLHITHTHRYVIMYVYVYIHIYIYIYIYVYMYIYIYMFMFMYTYVFVFEYVYICLIMIYHYMYGIEYTYMGDMLKIMWGFCGETKALSPCQRPWTKKAPCPKRSWMPCLSKALWELRPVPPCFREHLQCQSSIYMAKHSCGKLLCASFSAAFAIYHVEIC